MKSNPVTNVLTIGEITRAYAVGESTVRYHIDKGHLTFRQVAHGQRRLILVDRASVEALWGDPCQNIALLWVQAIAK